MTTPAEQQLSDTKLQRRWSMARAIAHLIGQVADAHGLAELEVVARLCEALDAR